jgi:hypothetical protein
MTRISEIITLWLLIILGFLAHTQADMLPLFWGQNITTMPSDSAPVGLMLFMAALTYMLPTLAILVLLYGKGRWARIANAVLSCIYGLFCILHMSEWAEGFNVVQLMVMPLMAVLGIVLAIKSVRYARKENKV